MKEDMKKITYCLVLAVFFLSCKGREAKMKETKQSDYTFRIPETGLKITISKRKDAQFYVMFSGSDSIPSLSDSIDYIECVTTGSDINIIFNPLKKDSIYFWYPQVKKINQVKYHLYEIEQWDRKNREANKMIYQFFKKGIKTAPDTLLKPYIHLDIIPSTYTIILNHDSKTQEIIKEGDIYGGW
jgi:hypothetical protein